MSREIAVFAAEQSTYFEALTACFAGLGVVVRRAEEHGFSDEAAALAAVRSGELFGALLPAAALGELSAAAARLDEPFVFGSRDSAHRHWDLISRRKLEGELRSHGLEPLTILDGGERQIFSRGRAIEGPADLAGLRFRTMPGSRLTGIVEAAGARAVEISAADFDRAMRAGEFDACERSISNAVEYRMSECFDHLSMTSHAFAASVLVADLASAASLDLPLLAMQCARAEQRQRRRYRQADERGLAELAGSMRIHRPTLERFRAAFTGERGDPLPIGPGDGVRFRRRILDADIGLYAGVTGDFSPNHVDARSELAAGEGVIAHGTLIMGLMSTASSLLHERHGRPTVSYGYDRVRFIAPIRPGDLVEVRYTVDEVDSRARRGVSQVVCRNQQGRTVAVATHLTEFLDDFEKPGAGDR